MRCNHAISVVLGLGLAAFVGALLRAERRCEDRLQKRQTVKEQIQTWDNEGGNIPNVATVRPEPGTLA